MPILRVVKSSDSARLAEIFAPYVLGTAITFSEAAPTEADFQKKIAEILPDFPYLVCEEGGTVVAYAYASKHRALSAYRWCAEVSIYAAPEARQKGAATLLYRALLKLLSHQGYVNLYAGITLPNPPSVALHEKFGFRSFATFEGIGFKLGEWRDVGWWALKLGEREKSPREPLCFSAVQENESAMLSRILAGQGEDS